MSAGVQFDRALGVDVSLDSADDLLIIEIQRRLVSRSKPEGVAAGL
jgi:hypothetical protein